jgi:transcriptional regulator with XRE-family HTH domain
MTKQELVERTRLIRKDVLKLTQSELAEEIGSSQALVSRMELDGKGTVDLLIDLFNFYEKKGIAAYMVWHPNFSVNMLIEDGENSNKSEINKLLEDVKRDLDNLTTRVNLIL